MRSHQIRLIVLVLTISSLFGCGGATEMAAKMAEEREGIAMARVMELNRAVDAYYTEHGATYPADLSDLLVQDELGGPYNGKKNIEAGKRPFPDIYCVNPNKTGQFIGNWKVR